MPLEPGTRLGPYEIQAAIGAGGMGEVYRARDTRLDRTVAIKVLSAELSADAERRARFEREAKAVAALSHPHICALYDVGEAPLPNPPSQACAPTSVHYLVMEHLEGGTLADRLNRGPLSVGQSLQIGSEIAAALATAHKQGIVHRDLKPSNVVLTRSGAKLLDFGLARLTGHGTEPVTARLSSGATLQTSLTVEGMIVGTLQYMAPEQLEGRPADARADIWALGAMLYEMVTGRRAFEGATAATLIGNIMAAEPPPLSAVQRLTPPALDRLVKKCLAKSPDERWDSAHDMADELRWLRESSGPGASVEPRAPAGRRPRLAFLYFAASALVVVAAGFALGRLTAPGSGVPTATVRFSVVADALAPRRGSLGSIAISPDGTLFVFGAGVDGEPTPLLMRRIHQDTVAPIPGTNGALAPFLSPDARWVAFFREGKLLRVPIEGGPAQFIASAPTGRGGAWRADGVIFFAPTFSGPIFKVGADGGTPTAVTALEVAKGENSHRFPHLMPGGDVLLFTVRTGAGFDDARIDAIRLSTGERSTLLRGGVNGQYVSSGHLLFGRATTLMAAPFQADRLETRGSPVPVLEGVDFRSLGGVSDFAASQNGTVVYVPSSSQPAELVRFSRDGSASAVEAPHAPYRAISLSPDGRQAVVNVARGNQAELSIVDLERGTLRAVSREHRDENPLWSPDGTRIFFASSRQPPMALFWAPIDSSREPSEIRSAGQWRFLSSVTPDGKSLLYGDYTPETAWDVWEQPLNGDAPARQVLATRASERYAQLSPDGRTLVFGSDESGRVELYAAAYPSLTGRIQISTSGAIEPVWSHSGQELFYRTEDALVAVRIDSAPRMKAGPPTVLFRTAFIRGYEHVQSYDVLPGDRGFLVIRALGGTEKSRIDVIHDWGAELAARVPPAR